MHDLKRTDAPLVLYVHGQGGSAREAEHYRPLFPGKDVLGLDYQADTPWDFIREVRHQVQHLTEERGPLTLIANSIGAYFSMSALSNQSVQRAFFISPVVDMERLITDMMGWARITEGQLKEAGRIHTDFGQTLDWYYLTYVRANPVQWDVPTEILYGDRDNLTTPATIAAFAQAHRAGLTTVSGGEHWFHTPEQMAFLDEWLREKQ